VLVSEGKTVELECRKPGTEKSVIAEWKYRKSAGQSASIVSFNRRMMFGFRRRRYSVKSSSDCEEGVLDFSLTISEVRRYDEGSYTCIIANQSAEMRRIVHLDVTG